MHLEMFQFGSCLFMFIPKMGPANWKASKYWMKALTYKDVTSKIPLLIKYHVIVSLSDEKTPLFMSLKLRDEAHVHKAKLMTCKRQCNN